MQHQSEESTWMSRFYPNISYYQPRCRFERLLIKIRIKGTAGECDYCLPLLMTPRTPIFNSHSF
ncbi:hypothetical protein F383_20793 [Gossypium arboreum]|uniref:Uncharacterized protein n=1 Tax=Gossypium arboreum TaxID=29729 RepID=A0A0B0MJK1_GOSAR|nr:hypothetical protein F383_20793 [Gossypium arboreum]